MLKVFVEEAAALASIVLFVGMIAIWAQLIPQLRGPPRLQLQWGGRDAEQAG